MTTIHDLLNVSGRQRLPMILQTETTECGLACLAMVASFHGNRVDLNVLRRRHSVSLKGATLKALMQTAGQLKLACRALRFDLHNLSELRLPAIVHWDMDHFVVLSKISAKGIEVHDPAVGKRRFTMAEASMHLTGVALELAPSDGFVRRDERIRLPLSALWGRAGDAVHALAQIFALSLLLEILVIASPFYLQIAVDEAVVKGDVELLVVLALGFGMLAAISVVSTALRSHIVLILQNTMNFRMVSGLFRHLLRLPLAYFEKRHVGDILSRFTSTEPIRQQFAEGLITALLDGIMAAATLIMIFVYSAPLASVVTAAVVFYAGARIALYRTFRYRSEEAIRVKALESSTFIETIRAIQCLKLFGREVECEGQWVNRFSDVVDANVRVGRLTITYKTLNDAIFAVENIVTIYLGTRLALDGALTIGMVFAFMSYKRHFTEKASQLVEKALEFRLLDLHLERLADIALTAPERGHDEPSSFTRKIQGAIELRDVSFRYADSEPFILEGVNLKIDPGEFVTISGASGGGKTTLVKVMLGLLEPSGGEVLVDGLPLSTIGLQAFRQQVSAVMQEDQFLSGSIVDNICFFDHSFDMDWVMECGRLACIHDEIMAMPMTYNSLIGEMGGALSGGQKQRILLARALYRRPQILVLDEGTAHLDVDLERRINENLKRLAITRISVAHRPETMRAADRIVVIGRHIARTS